MRESYEPFGVNDAYPNGRDPRTGLGLPEMPRGFHPDDILHVICDVLDMAGRMTDEELAHASVGTVPWSQYDDDPENDPKCYADGWRAVVNFAREEVERMLNGDGIYYGDWRP